jgi:hypothetical protein
VPDISPQYQWPPVPTEYTKKTLDDLEAVLARLVADLAVRVNQELLLITGGTMAGQLQFSPGVGWLLVPVVAGDMAGSAPGNIWYNSTLGKFRCNEAGTIKTFTTA